jgi:hypothetical protein
MNYVLRIGDLAICKPFRNLLLRYFHFLLLRVQVLSFLCLVVFLDEIFNIFLPKSLSIVQLRAQNSCYELQQVRSSSIQVGCPSTARSLHTFNDSVSLFLSSLA